MKFFGTGWESWRRPLIMGVALFLFEAVVFGPQLGTVEAQEQGADDAVTSKVLSLEQLWNQAEVEKDTHSLSQLLAENFIYVDVDGSLIKDKAKFLASVTGRAEHIESIRSESMLSQVHGNTVIVTGLYHEKGTLNGKPYLHHGRFTDTWVKEGSAWLCAASQSMWRRRCRRTCAHCWTCSPSMRRVQRRDRRHRRRRVLDRGRLAVGSIASARAHDASWRCGREPGTLREPEPRAARR